MKIWTTLLLLVAATTAKADIIWDAVGHGTTWEIITKGTIAADGSGGGEVLSFRSLESTYDYMPIGQWAGSGYISLYDDEPTIPGIEIGIASLSFSAQLNIPISLGGVDLLMPVTQKIEGFHRSASSHHWAKTGGVSDYNKCARDMEQLDRAGLPFGNLCRFGDYNKSVGIFFEAPRNIAPSTLATLAVSSVPEPGGLALLGLGALALIRRRLDQ